MKKALSIIIPILLSLAILFSCAWYLFVYDREFTRDMFLHSARFFENRGMQEASLMCYNLANTQSSDNDAVNIELAQQYCADGNYFQAEVTLNKAIAKKPSVSLYQALCRTYLEQDKLMDAVRLLDTGIDPSCQAEINKMRPEAPDADLEPGIYKKGQKLQVTLSSQKGALYINTNGEYPSITDAATNHFVAALKYIAVNRRVPSSATATTTKTYTLQDGTNNIYALAIADNGFVSPLAIYEYNLGRAKGGVVEEVIFVDVAVEAEIRKILNINDDRVLMSDALWEISEFTVPQGATNLEDLRHLLGLEKLTIENGPTGQLVHIEDLDALTEIVIKDTTVSSEELPIIGRLFSLEKLTIHNCSLSTTTGLEEAEKLIYLDLSKNAIRNISAISSMTSLQELNLQQNALIDLNALTDLTSLVKLDVSFNSITSLTGIGNWTELTELNVSNNKLIDLGNIGRLTGLNKLYASSNALASLSGISSCTRLTELDLSTNKLTTLSELEQINTIARLNVSHNEITELPTWSKDCSLVTIHASYNNITNVEPLSGLSHLNNVYLDYNPELSSVSSLAKCYLLIQVNLNGTKVTNVSALTDMDVIVQYDPT